MSDLERFVSDPVVHALGWALVHFVWQGAAAVALLAAYLLFLRRATANARYLASLATLLVMAACPILTAYWVWCATEPPPAPASASLPPLPMGERVGVRGAPDNAAAPSDESQASLLPPLETVQSRAVRSSSPEWPPRSLADRIDPVLPWLVAAWLVGVLALSVRLLAGWAKVQQLKRRSTQSAAACWQAKLAQLAAQLRVTRPVQLLESALVEVPTMIGWLRPVILLPASALAGLTPQQLEALLAHELAHIRRHDYLVNLLQTVIESLLFYHPAVWWVSSRIRAEREECCDELAISVCGDRVSYARALVTMEELRHPATKFAVAATGGSLLSRISRLLGRPETHSNGSARWLAGAVALAAVTALLVAVRLNARAEDFGRSDQELLQGSWVRVSTEMNGKIISVKPGATDELVVRGDIFAFGGASEQGELLLPEKFSLDPKKSPKQIDLTPLGEKAGPLHGVTYSGIYKLEGDRLTLCLDIRRESKRPEKFTTTDGRRAVIDVYQRNEKPDKGDSKPSETRDDSQGRTFTGRVTDAETGQPIEGATVAVRRRLNRVEPENVGKILAETKHQTDARGEYSFTVDHPAHPQRGLYIQIDVQHPKYAPIMGEGYSLDMIRKNQELGDPPFFAAIRLWQAAEVHGQVVTPDGEPAAGVRVLALTKLEINEPARNFEMLRTRASTDDQGRFRLMPAKDGRLLIYLESNNYSPLVKLVDGRGDLGRFTLQEGITLMGRLLDSAGQPLPARWVVARPKQDASVPADQSLEEARQVFYFQPSRSALTNDHGEYALSPLPPGAYSVTPTELSEHCFDFEWRPRPLSAAFYPRDVTLKAGAAADPLDFRAVPHVTVEVQCVNSKDEPQAGQEISIQGGRAELNQPIQWNSTGITDSAGKVRLLVPRGLEGVGLYTIDNEHHAVTFQRTKDSQPVPGDLKLGIVSEDVTGIILRRYASPIVLIKVSDEGGAPLSNVEIRVSNRSYTCWIEKHGDGRFRTAGLMPDAEATITVKATGYQTRTEKITLPESSTKDLEFVLEKDRQPNVITPKGGVDDPEVRALLDKLKDPNQRERRNAVRALGLLWQRATPAIPALIEKLKDDDPYIRTWAAFGLGRIGAAAKEAVPNLEAALDDPFGPTRREAAEALFRVDRQASKALAVFCELLRNPPAWPNPGNDDVAVSSQLMYLRADTIRAIGHIVRYAREATPPVDAREAAKPAVPILIDQLTVQHLRGPAVYSLGMIGEHAAAAIPTLVALLKVHAECSEPISVALARIGHDPAFVVPALLEDLQSEEVRIRYQVIESLGELGPHAKAAVLALRKALEDNDESVRAVAKKALEKIGAAKQNTSVEATERPVPPAAAQLPGRLFVNAGLRTTQNETRFVELAIAIDPNTGDWTQVQNLNADGFTVPLLPVRVSPDGRTMLFTRRKEVRPRVHVEELWKCDARSGERAERVLEKGSPAAWSPDGKRFVAVVPTKEADYQAVENWKVSTDGREHTVLTLREADAVEDWSPDGQWLAVWSRKDGQLYVVKPDGSGWRQLTDTGENPSRNEYARFSPDSRHMIYHRTLYTGEFGAYTAHFSLRTINVDGTGDREILGETKAGSEPDSTLRTAPMGARWSPDGKHLVVVLFDHSGGGIAAIGGNWRLAIIDADGGNLRELALEGVLTTVLPWDGPEWRAMAPPADPTPE